MLALDVDVRFRPRVVFVVVMQISSPALLQTLDLFSRSVRGRADPVAKNPGMLRACAMLAAASATLLKSARTSPLGPAMLENLLLLRSRMQCRSCLGRLLCLDALSVAVYLTSGPF